ncbi:hypothetical protein [uncultured Chryseobacterium sp.]|uniref:hypothetical protein n=1 Tax=uncultured Chryseobacterium sp. TaxID=259322 RepID=UPI0025D9FC3E|nr:hypothetical protein [uncultured Chryseobacterium sp.]
MEKITKFSSFIAKLERNMIDNNQESLVLTNFAEQSQGGFIGINDSRCINATATCQGSINDYKCSNGNCDSSMNGKKCTTIQQGLS